MPELWQLYSEDGHPIPSQGANKDDVYTKALLHAASHVWIWRRAGRHHTEVLVQKRAATKRTWPKRYDISAAGHIDIGETPGFAACREISEEIGLVVQESDLQLVSQVRVNMKVSDKDTENEFQYLYLLEISKDTVFNLEEKELEAVEWWPLERFISTIAEQPELFVPHSKEYFDMVIKALRDAASS